MLSVPDIIRSKRDGTPLSGAQLRFFVEAVSTDSVDEAQLGAFLMAVYFTGLSDKELVAMTLAMRDSGAVLTWKELDGPVLDKHSTGGVGDLVSLVLGPLIAACGGYVPMISGRSLGHTGGTLDKLESIPGFQVQIDLERFSDIVREAGVAIVGQGPLLAPADQRLYAARDVTATVGSESLIISSILSKKLAEGLDALVMDIKCGNGAFMHDEAAATHLAHRLCTIACQAGLPCTALVTDMSQPLAPAAGNALEVTEAICFLTGVRRSGRLESIIRELCVELLAQGGIEADRGRAEVLVRQKLDDGTAAERFARMVALQGGPRDLLERPAAYLPKAPVIRPCTSERTETVVHIDTQALGRCVAELGGGRSHPGDTIDPRVGLSGLCSLGDELEAGDTLAVIHAASQAHWEQAAGQVRSAMRLGAGPPDSAPLIKGRISAARD